MEIENNADFLLVVEMKEDEGGFVKVAVCVEAAAIIVYERGSCWDVWQIEGVYGMGFMESFKT